VASRQEATAQRELCDLWAVAPERRNLQVAVRCRRAEKMGHQQTELRSAPAGPDRDWLPPGDKELLPFMRNGRPFGKPLRNQEQRHR
jgi:hypothetical protein